MKKKMMVCAAAVAMMATSASAQSWDERNAKAQQNVERMQALEGDYQACVVREAVRMGKGNTEPSNNIVTAAFSKCQGIEYDYRKTWTAVGVLSGSFMSPGFMAKGDRYVAEMQDKAKPPAIAAVLDARASTPHAH
jgi:opacity protein-like surface antigen